MTSGQNSIYKHREAIIKVLGLPFETVGTANNLDFVILIRLVEILLFLFMTCILLFLTVIRRSWHVLLKGTTLNTESNSF
jgi:hypothetical protein